MEWFRDPRIGGAGAVAIGIVTGWLFAAAGRNAADAWLFGLVGFALAGWGWLAIGGMGWFWSRPAGGDVRRALRLHEAQHAFNTAAWNRFERDAAMLRMLMAERALAPMEAEIARQGQTIERFDAVAAALPAWSQAVAHWYDTAAQAHPAIPGATPVPPAAALDAAREQLPFGRDLHDGDLKAALYYLAARKRLAADRAAIDRERTAALRKLAAVPPQVPSED